MFFSSIPFLPFLLPIPIVAQEQPLLEELDIKLSRICFYISSIDVEVQISLAIPKYIPMKLLYAKMV